MYGATVKKYGERGVVLNLCTQKVNGPLENSANGLMKTRSVLIDSQSDLHRLHVFIQLVDARSSKHDAMDVFILETPG